MIQALYTATFLESSYTQPIQVRVIPTPLGAPSLTACSNDGFGLLVHLSWTAPTDQGGADRIDKYEVERRTPPGDGNGGTWTALTTPSPATGPAPTAWTNPGDLTAGTAYEYRVRARITLRGTHHHSAWSNAVSVTARSTTAGAPTNLSAESGNPNGEVLLDWDAPGDQCGADRIDKYEVERRTPPGDGNGGTWTALTTPSPATGPAPTTLDDAGVVDQTDYEYRVRSRITVDGVHRYSAWSATVETTAVRRHLGAPSSFTGSSGDAFGSVRLRWSVPTQKGGADRIDKYEVERRTPPGDGNGGIWTALTTPSPATGPAPTAWTDPGDLTVGTTYEYRVRARITLRGRQYLSAFGPPETVTVLQNSLTAPANLSATATATGVTLAWDAPTAGVNHNRIRHYEVERRTPPGDGNGGTWTRRSTPADPGGDDAPTRWKEPDRLFATTAVAYEYRVRAVIEDAYGNRLLSDWSTAATVTLAPPALGAPAGLVANPDAFGRIALDWRAPADRGGARFIDGYLVERRTPPGDGGGGTWAAVLTPGPSTMAASTRWTDPTVFTAGTQHEYRVRARITLSGSTRLSDWSTVSVTAGSVLGTPQRAAGVTDAFDRVYLTWEAPTTGVGHNRIHHYEVQRRTPPDDSSAAWTSHSTPADSGGGNGPTSWTDPDALTVGTSYGYRIRAAVDDPNGLRIWSNWSAMATVTVRSTTVGPPTNITARLTAPGRVRLTWDPPTRGVGGNRIQQYQVTRSTQPDGGGTLKTWVTAADPGGGDGPTGFTDPDRHTLGDAYWYRIHARVFDGAGHRPSPSEERSAWVQATVHGAPSALSGTSHGLGDAIVLTWNPPADDGGSPVTGYDVRYRRSGTTRWTMLTGVDHNPVPGRNSRRFTISGLTRGKFYTAEVRALAALPGPWSTISNELFTRTVVTIAAQATPVTEDDDVVFVIKTQPTSEAEILVSGAITVDNPAYDHLAGSFSIVIPAGAGQVTLTRASVQDSAEEPDGNVTATLTDDRSNYDLGSPASAVVEVTDDDELAGAPGTPTATPAQRRIALSWTAPTAPGQTDGAANTITDYRLQWADDNMFTDATSADVAGTSHTVTSLRSATAHWFRVCAVSPGGCGAWSASVKATTPTAPPSPPTNVAAAAGDRSVRLTWSAPADAGGYPVTAYDVRHRAAGTAAWTVTADAWRSGDGALEYRVPNLVNGTDYEFSLRTHNTGHGAGSWLRPSVTGRATTPVVTIAAEAAEVTEGTGAAFVFTVLPAPADPIKIAYHASGGAGHTQDDYTAGRDLLLDVSAGATSQTATFATVGDVVEEPDSEIVATLTAAAAGSGYALGASTSAKVKIKNDDFTPDAPTIGTLTGDLTAATLTVTWTAPTDDGGNPVTSYEVRHRASGTGGTGGWTSITGIVPTAWSHAFTPPDLGPAKLEVQVRAVTATAAGDWSSSLHWTFCVGGIVFKDCRILLLARDTLTGTTGGGLNWSVTRDVSDWTGVSLSSGRRVNVVRLWGRDDNNIRIRGTLPPILGGLDALLGLEVVGYDDRGGGQDSAYLAGTIPVELGNLSILRVLVLANNEVTGSIPTELASLSELTVLDLSGNGLTGGIPAELGDLRKLVALDIENNPDLGGAIPPELGDIPTLTSLVLNRTGLTGSIPSQLGDLTNLRGLGLERNNLTGSIPTELGNLTALVSFRLNLNDLSGDIPHELGALTLLRQLYIADGNRLTGCLPAAWYTVPAVAQSSQPNTGNDVEQAGLLWCAPVDLQATRAGDRRIRLDWEPPRTASTLSRTIDGYEVQHVRGSDDISAVTATRVNAATTTLSSLTAGSEYRFRVRYILPGGARSRWSAEARQTPTGAPGAPAIDRVTPGNGSLRITWSPPTDTGGLPISGYRLQVSRGAATSSLFLSGRTTETTWGGLTNGVEYDITLWARNRDYGYGPPATAKGTPAPPPRAPRAPTITRVANRERAAVVHWTPSPEDQDVAITGFDVRHRLQGSGDAGWTVVDQVTDGDGRQHEIGSLTNNQNYDIQVRAVNGAGESPWSATATARPAFGVTIAPTTLRINECAGADYTVVLRGQPDHYVTIDVAVTSDGNRLTVSRQTVTFDVVNWNIEQTVTVSAPCDDQLGDYTGTVTHTVDNDNSHFSYWDLAIDAVAVTVGDMDDFQPPSNLRAAPGDGRFTASWDLPTFRPTSYVLRYGTDQALGQGATTISYTADTKTAVITSLTNGTTYYLNIRSGERRRRHVDRERRLADDPCHPQRVAVAPRKAGPTCGGGQ